MRRNQFRVANQSTFIRADNVRSGSRTAFMARRDNDRFWVYFRHSQIPPEDTEGSCDSSSEKELPSCDTPSARRNGKIIQPILPNKPHGIPRVDDRRILNGIFWVLRSGAQWRHLPDRYGPCTTCYNRFVRWRRAGIWDKIMDNLTAAHDGSVQMIDTSVIPRPPARSPRRQRQSTAHRPLSRWANQQASCRCGRQRPAGAVRSDVWPSRRQPALLAPSRTAPSNESTA